MSYNRSPIPNDGTGTGTVTSVSVVTAAGVSGSVADPGTTPAITIALGDITPSSVGGVVIASGTVTADNVVVNENGTVQIVSTGTAFKAGLAAQGGMAADVMLALPATYGSTGDVLQTTDSFGTLGWSPPGVTQNTLDQALSSLNGKQVADLFGTSNVALTGVQTIDGAPTSNASIVCLNGQTDPTENGLWANNDFGPWVRPGGWSGGSTIVPGALVSVREQGGGVSYSNTLWLGTGDGSSTTSPFQQIPVGLASNTGWGSITNVTPDKAYNANATTVDELADVLGTLIAQLILQGVLRT